MKILHTDWLCGVKIWHNFISAHPHMITHYATHNEKEKVQTAERVAARNHKGQCQKLKKVQEKQSHHLYSSTQMLSSSSTAGKFCPLTLSKCFPGVSATFRALILKASIKAVVVYATLLSYVYHWRLALWQSVIWPWQSLFPAFHGIGSLDYANHFMSNQAGFKWVQVGFVIVTHVDVGTHADLTW